MQHTEPFSRVKVAAGRLSYVRHPDSWYYEIEYGDEKVERIITIGEEPDYARRASRIEKLSVS